MEQNDVIQVLRRCPLLADIGLKAITQLAPHLGQMRGSAGDVLYNEGDEANGMYIIAEGSCVAFARDMNGINQDLRGIPPFESFGELSLLLRGQRLMGVRATSDVTLLDLSASTFRALKQQEPELCLIIVMAIVRKLGRELDESREVMKRIMLRYHAGIDGR